MEHDQVSAPKEPATALHVVELRSSNVKKLRAVRIRPGKDGLVIIGGKNAAGKSSVIDSIAIALGGAKSLPIEPIRHGARSAHVQIDLGEFVVTKNLSAKGAELVIRGKDGKVFSSPQTMLDALIAPISFDPVEFVRLGKEDPRKQDALLRRVVGLDTAKLDAERADVCAARAELNRDVKKLEARAAAMPEHPDAPDKAVAIAELATELQEATRHNEVRAAKLRAVDIGRMAVTDADTAIREKEARVAKLQEELVVMRRERGEKAERVSAEEARIPDGVETAALHERIKTAEATNAKVRSNAARADAFAAIATEKEKARTLTEAIDDLDAQRAALLAAVKFPVAGLAFDADIGPTLNGAPLAQASQAELLRVSVAVAVALNPRIRVALVRDGSLLDDDSMKLLAELAQQHDLQCWVERVSDKDEGAIIIEEGEVRGGGDDNVVAESDAP